jgi:tetratricopeptide (TPR) repeat protein
MKAKSLGARLLFTVVLAVFAAACSSAPPKSDTTTNVKNQAADAEVSGQQYFSQGRYELALQFFTQALDANGSVDNVEGVIRSRTAIGQVYLATGRLRAAQDMLTAAREQARTRSAPLFIDASISLGELYLREDDPQKSLGIFQETISAPQVKLTPMQTGVLYHDIGAAWKASGDLAKALDWLSKALQNNVANKLLEPAAADYYMIASVHSKEGDFVAASSSAEQALAVDKKIENTSGIAKDLYAMALIAAKKGDTPTAYDYYQRAYSVFTSMGDTEGMKKSLTQLVSIAQSLGRDEEAQGYQKALAKAGVP